MQDKPQPLDQLLASMEAEKKAQMLGLTLPLGELLEGKEPKLGRIEFTLPMQKKNAYVRTAQAEGKKLVDWMVSVLDANAIQIQPEAPPSAAQLLASFVEQAKTQHYLVPDDARHFKNGRVESQKIRVRILIERAIIRKVVQDALAIGDYVVSVDNGEDIPIRHSRDLDAIMDEIGACDEERLIVHQVDAHSKPVQRVLIAMLVYGNDGYDVIADRNTGNAADQLCEGADALSDDLGEALHILRL